MNQPELGKKILELRLNLGLTQGELAENCNLSLRTVQRIESAEVVPRSHTIKVIFSSLNYEASSEGFMVKILGRRFFKSVFELFNLKKNTMKKVSVLSSIAVLLTAGLMLTRNDLKAQEIEGWFLSGTKPNSYNIGLDETVYKTGSSSAFLESVEKKIEGFGTLMQTCSADQYLGKRIKMTAYIKSDKVSEWAGMWLRVDSKETKKSLSFDNMQDRPIQGNKDWAKYEIILDVPDVSGTLNFGILLKGTGKVWFDSIAFEVVDVLDAKLTSKKKLSKKPLNLDFGD